MLKESPIGTFVVPLCAGTSTFHTKETTNAEKMGICTFQGAAWWTVECVKQPPSQLFPRPWLLKRLVQTVFFFRCVASLVYKPFLIIQAAKATLLSLSIKVTRCSVCRARCLCLAVAEMSLHIRVHMSIFFHVSCIAKLNAIICIFIWYENIIVRHVCTGYLWTVTQIWHSLQTSEQSTTFNWCVGLDTLTATSNGVWPRGQPPLSSSRYNQLKADWTTTRKCSVPWHANKLTVSKTKSAILYKFVRCRKLTSLAQDVSDCMHILSQVLAGTRCPEEMAYLFFKI